MNDVLFHVKFDEGKDMEGAGRIMVFELKEIDEKIYKIFEGWEETMIYSCLQNVMGKIYVTDINNPKSACAFVGCFAFYGGVPDKELIENKPTGFIIMVPQNKEWAALIEECFPSAKKVVRYAIRKDTKFNIAHLEKLVKMLPDEYTIQKIDGNIYDKCLLNSSITDFVSSFESKEKYLELGRGVVVLKDGKIVSGASSYTRYKEGIEIQVDTILSERQKHLATVVCASLILDCLKENLYPSWDAQNMNSVRLAEKLGYKFSHEYIAYEVNSDKRN